MQFQQMVTEYAKEEASPVSFLVDGASMAERHDDHHEYVVGHGVDDAVVTHPDPETGSTLQSSGGRWMRVVRQQCNGALKSVTNRRIELPESSNSGGPQLDAVLAHIQPRSALTCSHGMFGPSSPIAASKAAMSSASSRAVMSLS